MHFANNYNRRDLVKTFHSLYLIIFILLGEISLAQVTYGTAASYGLRKLSPAYVGNAVQIRRACDNATLNLGFNSCGHLDTTAMKNFVWAANPLSAITSSAAVAYSLRKMRCAYAGSAIQVRRSGDNTVQNIGFTTNGDLDTAALKTFVVAGGGTRNGFVTTWYDQSTNGRNATQTLTVNQPQIVNSGTIYRQNGMPSVLFSGTAIYLTTSLTGVQATTTGNITTANFVFQSNNSVAGTIFSNGDGGTNRYNIHTPWSDNVSYFDLGNISSGGRVNVGLTWPSLSIGTFRRNGTQGDIWKNGTNIITTTGFGSSVTSTLTISIGGALSYSSYMAGYISEITVFPVALSTTEREYLEWSQSQYYTIGSLSLNTLPANPESATVATWYDQSGNSRHISQTTTTRQPQLVNAGIINKIGVRPSIVGNNVLQTNLTLSLTSAYTGIPLTAVSLFQPDANSTANLRVMSIGSGTASADWSNNTLFNVNERSTNQFVIERNGVGPTITATIGAPLILTTLFNGTNRQLFNNGNASSTVADANAFNFNMLRLLQSINPSFEAGEAFTGRISEFHLFYSALNTTRRTLIETNQAVYNNVTITGSKFTPPTTSSYNLYVNGIGYTSSTDSVAGTRITSGMGFSSPGVTATDFLKNAGDYLTIGIDCPVISDAVATNIAAPVTQRWANDWYLNKTDAGSNNGLVTVFFDFSDYGIFMSPGVASNYRLLNRNSTAATFSVIPNTTVTVSGDRVLFLVNTSNIPTNSYYTIGSINTSASPLPIELTSFDAQCVNTNINVTWSTATETNNDYFSVERSIDGITYQTIGIVNGAGNSLQHINYSFIDKSPLDDNAYYRLKQTNYNHTVKEYNPVSVVCLKDLKNVIVYPNPGNTVVTIEGLKTAAAIRMYNQLGEEVVFKQSSLEKADIDISDLSNGIYFLKVEDKNSSVTKKFVIQH